MKTLFFFFLILIISSSLVYSIPELPMIISGDVNINEKPAKIGTKIIAKVDDKEITKVEIKEEGKFTFLLQKLNEGDIVKIYVDNIDTEKEITFSSGGMEKLDLNVKKRGVLIDIVIIASFLSVIAYVLMRKKR